MLRMQSSKDETVLAVIPGLSLRSHLLLSPRLKQGQLNVSLSWAESVEKQEQEIISVGNLQNVFVPLTSDSLISIYVCIL
jgi:hypothetical protein